MASNFKIATHKDSDSLHLKLMGDFDGTSAYELLNVLKKKFRGIHRVFIHTGSLKKIYPFGLNTFHSRFSELNRHSIQILFTGENASQIAPENSNCL